MQACGGAQPVCYLVWNLNLPLDLEMELGCPGSLISIKDRHTLGSGMARQTVGYAKSLTKLRLWEEKNITETMSFTKERK